MKVLPISISIIAVIALIIAIGVIIITVMLSAKKKKIMNPPLLTEKATVSSKRYAYKNGNVAYCISFNVIGKGTVELAVPQNQFEILNEGDFGTLAYQGNKFFGFSKP